MGLLAPAPPSASLSPWQARAAALGNQVASLLAGRRNRPLRDRLHPATRTDDDRLFAGSTATNHRPAVRRYDGPVTYFGARR